MRIRGLTILIGIALIVVASPLLATDHQPAGDGSQKIFKLDTPYERMSHAVDLWHDAILRDNESAADEYYAAIIAEVDHDIAVNRRLLKIFAEQRLLQHAANDVEERNLLDDKETDADLQADRLAIEQMAVLLNTKVSVRESLDRAQAFSNRYRLLGDYINLLRKELKIPKVKLAYETAQSPDDESK